MSLKQASSAASPSHSQARQGEAHLWGGRLIQVRIAWGTVVVLVLALFLVSLPTYLTHLRTVCLHQPCAYLQLTLNGVRSLKAQGVSLESYAALTLTITLGAALVWVVLAGVLVWRRSDDWMALLVAFMLVVGGASNGLNIGAAPSQVGWELPANLLGFLNSLAIVVVFSLFPSGHFAPRWTRWLILAFLLGSVPYQFFAGWYAQLPGWASLLGLLDFFGSLLLLILAQIYRYWRVSTPLQRQQTKWILFSLTLGIVAMLGWGVLERFFSFLNGSLYDPANAYLNALGSLIFPIAFAVAILRYRLWEIDTIINRTLVYGALTVSVIALYVLMVGYLGTVLRTGNNLFVSLVATGLVAVIFQPLRGWLQGTVNRLLYGQRDEPYAVITQLSQRLEGTLVPDAVLPTIVETVAKALKLPYVAIVFLEGGEFNVVAAYGTPVEEVLTLALIYQAEPIGNLLLGTRKPGEAFTPADRRLLNDLARQAGLATHAVRLTADLRRSREHLVTAREEERRRLRRDLHDGLGASLAALHLQAGAIRTLIHQDLSTADTELLDLQAEIRSAVGDVRRLVYALRPPTLDEFGLVGAIEQYAAQYDTLPGTGEEPSGRLRVAVETPTNLPTLPAAVEVAAYRIVQEALTNVVHHAQARTCRIRLSLPDASLSSLQIEIIDDGIGLPKEPPAGVGLHSMRERAEEVGGSCMINSTAAHGTQVLIHLPLPKEETNGHAPGADR